MTHLALTKTLFLPKKRLCMVFVLLFFTFNLFQQWGRREDYPFTYFGMYKEGRLETKSFYQFKIYYLRAGTKLDIASLEMDHYYLKKKLDALLLDQTYLPNNDTLTPSQGIQEGRQPLINKLFIKDVIPQLKKRKLPLENSTLLLRLNYWNDLSPKNAHKPDQSRIYHSIEVDHLLSKEDFNE